MVDFRTLFLIFGLISVAGAIIMYMLWSSEHKTYKGMMWFLVSFIGQSLSLTLVFLRGYIPDVLSIVIMNFITVFSVIAILVGVKRFYGKQISYWPWAILLFVHVSLQAWFTLGFPNLHHRNLVVSISYLIVSARIFWVLISELNKEEQHQAKALAVAFLLYSIIDCLRIANYLVYPVQSEDYFYSGNFELGVMLAYFFVYLLQLFGIVIMVNRALQTEMKLANEKFFKVFNHSPNAIILTRESDGYIAEVNKGLEDLAGIKTQDIVGRTTIDIGFWFDPNARNNLVSKLADQGSVKNFEAIFKKTDGSCFTGLISCDPIQWRGERYILSTIEDISEQRALLDKLNLKAQELTNLNASKDKFFSIIAHDLKGPFNNVTALANLLEENIKKKDYSEVESYVQMIHKSADKALGLLLNLLDWARLQTGRMEYSPQIIPVCELVTNEIEIAELSAAKKQIRLVNDCKSKCLALADPNMLSSVFRNFLSNAIKFTPNGGEVSIRLTLKNKHAHFVVSDTGVGMEKSKIEKLFTLDSNISTPGTNQESGTGLGLLLCKEYLEKHGSMIHISSEVGKGTQISFELPIAE